MTNHDITITTTEQAVAQLRATRAAGHYIDWDAQNDSPDIVGAAGIEVGGYLSREDIESLHFLLNQPAPVVKP